MGVTKTTIKEGSGAIPKARDEVVIEYTGWLKDTSKPDNKGKQYGPAPNPPFGSANLATLRADSILPSAVATFRPRLALVRLSEVNRRQLGRGCAIKANNIYSRLGRGCHPDEDWREGYPGHYQVCLHPSPSLESIQY